MAEKRPLQLAAERAETLIDQIKIDAEQCAPSHAEALPLLDRARTALERLSTHIREHQRKAGNR